MDTKLHGHYVSLHGLKSIFDTELLWATNVNYLNDKNEYTEALNYFKKYITEYKCNFLDVLGQDFSQEKLEEFKSALEIDKLDNFEKMRKFVFTVSFSEEDDLLSQWRGYCPDNNGYCIDFDLTELDKHIKSNCTEFTMRFDMNDPMECVYEDIDKKGIYKDMLDNCWSNFVNPNIPKDNKDQMASLNFYGNLPFYAAKFKNKSFKEEREKRFVLVIRDDRYNAQKPGEGILKFRTGQSTLIPYIEMPITLDAIKKIIIGPCLDKELSKSALEFYLENLRLKTGKKLDIDVSFSKIPYRPYR